MVFVISCVQATRMNFMPCHHNLISSIHDGHPVKTTHRKMCWHNLKSVCQIRGINVIILAIIH